MSSTLMYILIGIIIGWVTKVPFMPRFYRKLQKEREEYKRMIEHWKEISNNETITP